MRSGRFGAFALVLVVLATGCVGGDQPAQAVGPELAAAGGTLRLGTTTTPRLDPLEVDLADPLSVVVADAVFDGLTAFDSSTRRVVGAVARDWSTADGKVWMFHLDPERAFADGHAIRAADVIASLERAARDPRQALAAARLEMIDGVSELRRGSASNAIGLASVDGSVQVTLTEANNELPAILADPIYGIVPPGDHPEYLVGSGPLGLAERDGAVLTLHPAWPEAVQLDGVTIRTYDSEQQERVAFDRHEIDVRVERGDAIEEAPAVEVTGVATRQWVSAVTLYVGVNTTAPGLDDATVRQALLSAVDPQRAVEAIGATRAREVTGLLPGDVIPIESCGACFEVRDGRDEVLAAFGDGGVRLLGLGSGSAGVGAEAVEAALVDAGVVVSRPDATAGDVRAAVLEGSWDLVVFAEVGVVPSPDPHLGAAFTSTGRENLTGWSSPVVDGHVAAARAEPEEAARRARYAAAELEVRREAVARPLVALGATAWFGPRVRGAEAFGGLAFDVRRVSLGQ